MDDIPTYETDVCKRLNEVTANGDRVGFDVRVFPEQGRIRGTKSLVLYTVGLRKLGCPELVFFLGPRVKSSPIPADAAIDMTKQLISKLTLDVITKLVEVGPLTFLVKEPSPRRFLKLMLSDIQKASVKNSVLSHLSAYYLNQNYDFVAYEADAWLH